MDVPLIPDFTGKCAGFWDGAVGPASPQLRGKDSGWGRDPMDVDAERWDAAVAPWIGAGMGDLKPGRGRGGCGKAWPTPGTGSRGRTPSLLHPGKRPAPGGI